ncbi:MAG: hypothetical protein PVJ86_09050 [Phycisphaerales bacterium]
MAFGSGYRLLDLSTVPSIALKKGDEIEIGGRGDGDDWARIDFVEFISETL